MADRRLAIAAVAVLSFAAACATRPATEVVGQFRMPTEPRVEGATLDVTVESLWMQSMDSVEGSAAGFWARNEEQTRRDVRKQAPYDVHVFGSNAQPTSRYRCRLGVHERTPWTDVLFWLLPVPHSSNGVVCVTAELRDEDSDRALGEYEECGYSSKHGFWLVNAGRQPTTPKLREVLVSRVFAGVVNEFRAAARESAPLPPVGAADARQGEAVLFVYREPALARGKVFEHEIYVNGEYLATVPNGSYVAYSMAPGDAEIVATQSARALVPFTINPYAATGQAHAEAQGPSRIGPIGVTAGEVRYFEVRITFDPAFTIEEVNPSVGAEEIADLRLIEPAAPVR